MTTRSPPRRRAPVHPGEILRRDFLDELGLTAYRLAREIDVPPNRITGILGGKRAMTAETALRLGRFFGMSPEVWMSLQADYELEVARRRHGAAIRRIKALQGVAARPA